ncbi:hypothetical protein QAD02_000035 [Eretmocerus hayati]|uniref:Uncharacterized protein n=1 Tax=Eretmocerus hayati TaxID=131215 RepID=A0ACC2NCX5_9HYME|nr:hypothetical protein QAD02_000035 [Eretmocerus hayati]
MEQLHGWITEYFNQNATHQEIILLLLKNHGKRISHSSLKQHLRFLGLKRRNIQESNMHDICLAIAQEVQSCSGCDLGYRGLWQKLKHTYKLEVKRETVYFLLSIADPEGMARRRANRLKRREFNGRGPNWIWSMDGYDKLKPFGFCIHGAIDGFSRYVLWLRTATTNNNPRVTARYFLEAVANEEGVPTLVRCDDGTENVVIETLQTSLRDEHEDELSGERSFIYGPSTHNQRIESYWGQLRKNSMNFYIDLFKSMKDEGLFNGREEEKKCLQFCFGHLIQNDLNETRELWNKHHIRKQRYSTFTGKPCSMYRLPEMYDVEDHKKPVDMRAVHALMEEFTEEPQIYDPDFAERALAIMPNLVIPTNADEASDLYCDLKAAMDF